MAIFGKGSKLSGISKCKCPRCRQGEVFESNNPYNLSKMFDLHEHCDNCGLRYMIEPAFFYGAMYVSYGLTVALGVATFVLAHLLFDPTMWQVISSLGVVLVLGSPLVLRFSRIMYMYMM